MNTAPVRPRAGTSIPALMLGLSLALATLSVGTSPAHAVSSPLAVSSSCQVTSASIIWGFKEAFRSYISSTIARGEWTVTGGATYETPNFTFTAQDGSYDPATAEGEISFPGAVTFTGHGGVLNTTVGNPRIEFDGDSARLYLDVTGETQAGDSVEQAGVHFADIDLSVIDHAGADITMPDAPVTLSEDGSAAFGTYEPGAELDTVTIMISVADDCDAPAAMEDEIEPEATPEPAGQDEAGADWLPWVIAGVVLIAVIALVLALLVRRRGDTEV